MPSDKNRKKSKSGNSASTGRSSAAPVAVASDSGEISGQSIVGVRSLTLRYDASTKQILQVNSPFAEYVKSQKEDLVGKNIQILARSLSTDIFKVVTKPPEKGTPPPRVTDSAGMVYEILTTLHDGVIDVVLRDVTEAQQFKSYVHRYFGLELESLSDEDKRTLSFPERRFITISFTDLRGFTKFTEGNNPEEVRNAINAYFDEVIEAAEENGAFPNQLVGDEVMVLYGAPKHYTDHPMRAIKTACEHIERVTQLRLDYARRGKEIPHCGIGINSGDVIVGDMGSSKRDRKTYTALGTAVNLAARLCSAAAEGEIIISETTLKAVLNTLPENWEMLERFVTTNDSQESSGDKTNAKIEGVIPLPKSLEGKEILIGPGVATKDAEPEYHFKYLHQIKAKGIANALPVLEVKRVKKSELAKSVLSEKTEASGDGEMILGKYRLISHIGTGGMGTVWKARDEFANILAIKMLKAGHDASESQIARFKREAKVMGKLAHRNICRIHEIGKADGRIFLSMQFIDGISLEQLITHQSVVANQSGSGSVAPISRSRHSNGGEKTDFSSIVDSVKSVEKIKSESKHGISVPDEDASKIWERTTDISKMMTTQQVLSIISSVCEAVQFAHERGVLHRDLKPANIMIGRDGEPVVMDFGLAKLTERGEGVGDDKSMSLSLEGQIVGTIEYMAPEQALSSKEVTEQADVFSIGAIFYHLITGHKPFHSTGNLLSDAKALQDHEPTPPRKLDKYIDEDLETIILKALQPDQKLRYRSASQIRHDLEQYQNGDPISARKPTLSYRLIKNIRKNKILWISGVVIALLVGGFSGWAIVDYRKNYGDWNLRFDEDFTDGDIDQKAFIATDKKGNPSETLWEPMPEGEGVRLLQDQWLWLVNPVIRGDVKVEVKMRYTGDPEGFQICINGNRGEATAEPVTQTLQSVPPGPSSGGVPPPLSSPEAASPKPTLPDWNFNPTGYSCRFGIWSGSLAIITANEAPEAGPLNRHIPAPVPMGQSFTLTFQRQEGVLTMMVNNEEVHRETVLVPLSGIHNLDIGFRTWSNHLLVESITVFRFSLPQSASPSVAGDALAQIGETEKALEKYLSIAEDYSEEAPGEMALTKAYQVWTQAYLTKKERTKEQDKFKDRIIEALGDGTNNPAIRRIEAPLSALDLFSRGDYQKALELYPEIMELDRNSRIVMECLQINNGNDHAAIPANIGRAMVDFVAKTKNVGAVDLRSMKLTDITPLSQIRELTAVDIRENRLKSLDALAAMPLEALYCQNNQITSLDPIRSGLMGVLYCGDNQITSLDPLSNLLNLYELNCENNQITDLSALKGTKYQIIYCQGNQISDLSPLQGKEKLHTLYCSNNPITDLTPLKDLPELRTLDISGTNVVSVAPLKDHPMLETLYCKDTQITDLDLLPPSVSVWAD